MTAGPWIKSDEMHVDTTHAPWMDLAVVNPSSSTGSTTGHVRFFVETKGNNIELLGGNQGDKVSIAPFKQSTVLGYRWPTTINHYLFAGTGVLT
ncbi:MAG: hypothetical protein ACRENP_28515 [Longimicrobiales bacterium]